MYVENISRQQTIYSGLRSYQLIGTFRKSALLLLIYTWVNHANCYGIFSFYNTATAVSNKYGSPRKFN